MSTTAPATIQVATGQAERAHQKARKHRKFNPWGVVAWIVALGFFFPVFWMVLTVFKQEADAYTDPRFQPAVA